MMSPKEYLIKLRKLILTQTIDKNNIKEPIEEKTDSNLEEQDKETINKILEEATKNFFPKTGKWSSICFKKSDDLIKQFLPCHLRDDEWLAKMLKKDQDLFNLNHEQILNYIKTSNYFTKRRHSYEQKIVKRQIEYMRRGGEDWICDENNEGDLWKFSPQCDIIFRKGIVDTLTKIGLNKDTIEEGIEKNSLWRDLYMNSAFNNQFDSVFVKFSLYNQNKKDIKILPSPDEEHRKNWLKMRKYLYYQEHKTSVDKYGKITPEMLMTKEEATKLEKTLKIQNEERYAVIEEYRKKRTNNIRILK